LPIGVRPMILSCLFSSLRKAIQNTVRPICPSFLFRDPDFASP
jgi:hypothetical protein